MSKECIHFFGSLCMMWTDILDIQFNADENRDGSHGTGLFAVWPPDVTNGLRKFYCI